MQQETPISEATASFIKTGVSIVMASRDSQNRPVVGRALGCRLSPDKRHVTVLLSAVACEPLVRAAVASGVVAVVFTQPTTHRSIQIKGAGAELVPVEDGDALELPCRAESFGQELRELGYGEAFIATFVPRECTDVVALRFEACSGFNQTPGPRAGRPFGA